MPDTQDTRILIVGGGVAGSTLAFSLQRLGLKNVTVAEARAESGSTGGAFLTLAPNGINALRAIGLGDVPKDAGGFEQIGIEFHNASGRRIAELSGEDDLRNYGARGMVLMRSRLQEVLADCAQHAGTPFLFDARLVELHERSTGIEAVFDDGRIMESDIVIGADGIWSTVRRVAWPAGARPSYTGIVDCGGVTRVTLPDTSRQQMYFGRRAFFGYVVKDSQAYWFTNVPRPDEPKRSELDNLDPGSWLATIRALHAKDPDPVRTILNAADGALGAWPVYDMPDLAEWATEKVCLIGDAAHAVSPSSGQGASLAIEDAVVLAHWLYQTPSPEAAFASFVRERKARAESIVKFGRQIGDRKIASAAGNLFRDLTLGFFLRMGANATKEQYSYRVPMQVDTKLIDTDGAARV